VTSWFEPVAGTPGVWSDRRWKPGAPGTYAVVIGVSRYAHLDGGPGPRAADTYGLGQLAVSALTAYKFFEWLRDDYFYDGAPLVRCRLLLAPSDEEAAVAPGVAEHALTPTIGACETSIREWYAEMAAVKGANAEASRAFFLFSGHGIEVTQDAQVLLPADYLGAAAGGLNDAVSTANVRRGLARLKIPTQFMFVDACRNDHERLRTVVLDGRRILDEHGVGDVNPDVKPSIILATGSGSAAWQPSAPAEGTSLYGSALVEGLEGQAGWVSRDNLSVIDAIRLGEYVDGCVRAALTAAGSRARQPIFLQTAIGVSVTRYHPLTQSVGPGPPSPPPPAEDRVAAARDAGLGWQTATRGTTHAMFGHETVTEVWEGSRVYDFQTGEWQPALALLELVSVDRARDAYYRAAFQQHTAGPLWWRIDDQLGRHVVLLPGVDGARWEVLFDRIPGKAAVTDIDVDLAADGPGALARAARLWQRYRYTDPATAADAVSEEDISDASLVVMTKKATPHSPFGAVVAGLVLLRAGRLDRVSNWLGNLADWFPDLPDGAALWAEQLSRQGHSDDAERALEDLNERRTLPTTGEALSYADGLVRALPSRSRAVAQLSERVRAVLPHYRPGGLLVTLFDAERRIEPGLVGRPVDDVPDD
jgi:Caspase domain